MIDIEYDNNIGVTFTCKGEFSFDEVFNENKNLFEKDNFATLKYWIIDRTQAEQYSLTTDQVKTLSEICINAANINKSLVHILISKTDLEYGLANMFRAYAEKSGWQFKSYKDINEAKQWIEENITS